MSPKKRIVIGLGGRPGSGKDGVARLLFMGWGIERLAFADSLKDELAATMDIDRALFDCRQTKEILRGLMRYWGAMRRREDVDYWVKRSGLQSGTRSVVVTDCRYQNELDAVRALGGLCLWVGNADAEAVPQGDVSEMLTADDFDDSVSNDKSNPGETAIQVGRLLWEMGYPPDFPAGVTEWRDSLLKKIGAKPPSLGK